MPSFHPGNPPLRELLDEIAAGKIQLPNFQRGWVWDDEHIRSLLVSIARSFPIGAMMFLRTGGEVRFQVRPIEGVEPLLGGGVSPERLILDGQQRLTSLAQVLRLPGPVVTRDEKKREKRLYYYFDIDKAMSEPEDLLKAIFSVDEAKAVRENFGRDIKLDLSTPEMEFEAFCFPCSQIMNSRAWEYGLRHASESKFIRFIDFREALLEPFRQYLVPVIELDKETKKAAVCLVFEKVNTGGVSLTVFELVTATWAADGFNLREDWYGSAERKGRHQELAKRPLLKELEPTDFLQGVSLLHSFDKRSADRKAGKVGKDAAAVTAKREHVLLLPLSAYERWATPLQDGFVEADRFLRDEGFHSPMFLPYRSQIVPLASVLALLKERWREPRIKDKLARWFWCGVLGELYGSAIESRVASDMQNLMAWIEDPTAPEPDTVQDAGFQPNRLDTLRSRTSAAYRGLYVLLQREGARDFFWKASMVKLDRDETKIDIHHIFPVKWCTEMGVPPNTFNSIVNKTAISYKANRMIGGSAPSKYLAQIQKHDQVQLEDSQMDDLLRSHLIEPEHLRADQFEEFYRARKQSLLTLVASAMGKGVATIPEAVAEDEQDENENGIDVMPVDGTTERSI